MICETPSLSRRHLLAGIASFAAWAHVPRFAHAAGGRDPRLLVVILRGALDGLSAVPPLGDADYEGLRASIALRRDGENAALGLDGYFALHPALPTFHRLYKAGQGLVVHATASPYRARSHFDGQDVLETGLPGVGRTETGWLNRAMAALPAGARIAGKGGLGVGPATPLILRGKAPVLGWAPPVLPRAGDDLAARVLDLYQHRDPQLMKSLAAALAYEGWDTHANEGGAKGRLANLLGGLDGAFAAFERLLQPVWKDTAVLVVTEFGRTARINGTEGTDHGTATVAFLLGGAVKGGRVIADWPGLKPAALFEGRDLAPTTDLRAVMKGLLAEHLGLGANVLAADVFPDSGALKPLSGLVA